MKHFLFALFLLLTLNFFAQKDVSKDDTLIYFTSKWKETKIMDSAKYYRIVKNYHLTKDEYEVTDYYLDGKVQMAAKFLAPYADDKKTGLCTWYHPNGNKSHEATYADDLQTGLNKEWYKDGKKKEEGHFEIKTNESYYVLENFWDSTGAQLVTNGTGVYKNYQNGMLQDECPYENGFTQGVWKSYYPNGKLHYEETFAKGILKKGTGYDTLGKAYKYKDRTVIPIYTESEQKRMYGFVRQKIEYPASLYKQGIGGEVLVLVQINEEGIVDAYKVTQKVHPALDAESVRVLREFRFKPAYIYGMKTSVWVTIPVNF